MRTVHTYTPAQQQEQQQQQPPPPPPPQQQQLQHITTASTTTNQPTSHQHSSMSGYPSVRHSLLRMHSQLRSAPHRRESSSQGGPIDLSIYRTSQQTPKMTTRSTSITTATNPRPVPSIVTPLMTPSTHNIYPNSASSSSSLQIATSISNYERPIKLIDDRKYSSRPSPSLSPKLAYSYSNIEENLQCPLCIDRLRDPRALPCQHVFCCSCLKSIPSSNLPYPTIACPLCRRTFPYNSADQFPISYIHRQLLELIPKNYDINGKCTKCQEKSSLILCSCCDYLLCQKCFSNDRQKILDNIEHIAQTCRYRLTRIDATHNQILKLNEMNRKKIQQIEKTYENFEKKYTENKQTVLNTLHQFNEQIRQNFWSKLNMPTQNTTECFTQLLDQADLVMKKSHNIQFDDILSLFYNLTSINEQLEQANTSIDTCDVQNLLKQDIQINSDEQMSVHFNPTDNNSTEKILPLIPSTILPRSAKRLRKTEPKRHVEQIDDDNNEDDDDDDDTDENLSILKRMKVEYQYDSIQSPTDSIFCLNLSNIERQDNPINDEDIIYVGSFQAKSPATPNFEELLQIISTNE